MEIVKIQNTNWLTDLTENAIGVIGNEDGVPLVAVVIGRYWHDVENVDKEIISQYNLPESWEDISGHETQRGSAFMLPKFVLDEDTWKKFVNGEEEKTFFQVIVGSDVEAEYGLEALKKFMPENWFSGLKLLGYDDAGQFNGDLYTTQEERLGYEEAPWGARVVRGVISTNEKEITAEINAWREYVQKETDWKED